MALIDLNSKRAKEARLSKKLGKTGYRVLLVISLVIFLVGLVAGFSLGWRYSLFILAPITIFLLPAIWWKSYLSVLPSEGDDLTSRLSLDILSLLDPNKPLDTQNLWNQLKDNWQSAFICHHLVLAAEIITPKLVSGGEDKVQEVFDYAASIADQNKSRQIELGFIIAGLLKISPGVSELLIKAKSSSEDIDNVVNWLARKLVEEDERKSSKYGGVGRDWAFGFTPLLDRFGFNVSLSIEKYGAHFGWLTDSAGVLAIEKAFDNHASAVALIGKVGIGKSNRVYALAQRLIEGKTSKNLAFHQIVSVNATDVTSIARGQGDLEHIMVSLANEAAQAGHIILFLDDAELFFSDAPGAFNASQILLSIIQRGNVPLILAIEPNSFERLKSANASLANLLTPVVLSEMNQSDTIRVLEDTALGLESKHGILVTYESLRQVYNLSGRYDQDTAYPGKAIKLLEAAVSYANQSVLTSMSVERAIEQTSGVKVSTASAVEANDLLNLEDKIHERMVNQSHAVKVVASSLRRARAGVTNPKRPIGSFLFLGPTGVGKTELAKSLAATYFKDEKNMIRLDMSEYQSPNDIKRLLSDGRDQENSSLILLVRQKPFSVILLDEVEKAHPNILNILLQLLDEGQLTDTSGRQVSFKDTIIIATSNAGANSIRERVEKGEELSKFEPTLIEEMISGNVFKAELINRFDEVVLFRPLTPEELVQVVKIMLTEINKTLAKQNIGVSLTDKAINKIVQVGYDPRLGARPMRRTLQKAVEDTVAQKILKGEARAGDHINLDEADLSL